MLSDYIRMIQAQPESVSIQSVWFSSSLIGQDVCFFGLHTRCFVVFTLSNLVQKIVLTVCNISLYLKQNFRFFFISKVEFKTTHKKYTKEYLQNYIYIGVL